MAGRRAPIDRLFDLAVAVPTCTMVAAARAVPIAARVGTVGTARVVGRISEAVHEARHPDENDEAAAPVGLESTVESPSAETSDVVADELPIEGYDDLAARQVVDRLGDLEPVELVTVEAYERSHRNRSTVLGKIAMLRA